MNKKGRKYDREKWGWKDESELHNHQLHPYYTNDHKLKTEKFSLQAISFCIVAMIALTLLIFILR